MNITIIQGPFLPVPAIQGGAVEKLWHDLGCRLSEHGIKVTHISKRVRGQELLETDSSGVKRIRIKGFSSPKNPALAKLYDLIYSIRAAVAAPRSDIYVTNTFFLPILPFWGSTGKIYVSVHRFPRRQHLYYYRASRFQCVSTVVAEELVRQYPSENGRTKVIPNFVKTGPSSWNITHAQEKFARKTILYVGRIHPEKGVDRLIKAFASLAGSALQGWRLVIVGPHEFRQGGGGGDYLSFLKELGVTSESNIEWRGPIFDPDALSQIYSEATYFCYPSVATLGEAFGLAPLEAMTYHTPAVVSKLRCFEDFLCDSQNGWAVDVESEGGLTGIFSRLATLSISEYYNVCENAYRASLTFSIESVCAKLIEDFNLLMGRNGKT